MITITESAAQQLRTLLKNETAAEQKGLRVQIAKGGCSGLQYEMSLDEKRPMMPSLNGMVFPSWLIRKARCI